MGRQGRLKLEGEQIGGKQMDKQPKILVVDNEPSFVELARNALEASSYQVIVASDRKGGLEKARKEAPDLVIVGALEPRGDAFKLHQELRDNPRTEGIPMLVVDVRPEQHSQKGWRRDEGMQMAAEGYVSRPIEPAELVEHVGGILERAAPRPIELGEVLERMEQVLKRVERIERALVK
jgi:DNA-binding response OmpR family regulator